MRNPNGTCMRARAQEEMGRLTAEHASMLEAKATAQEAATSQLKAEHASALQAAQAELAAAQHGAAAFGAADVLQERLQAAEAATAEAAEAARAATVEKEAALQQLAALQQQQQQQGQSGGGGAAQKADGAAAAAGGGGGSAPDDGKQVGRSLSLMRKGLGAKFGKLGAKGGGAEAPAAADEGGGAGAAADGGGMVESAQLEQLARARAPHTALPTAPVGGTAPALGHRSLWAAQLPVRSVRVRCTPLTPPPRRVGGGVCRR